MRKTSKRIVVGMSGGVDSSVVAALLVAQRHEVTGVFLECWNEPGCRTDDDRKDALKVATQLDIPFVVLDYKKEYRARVVEYFYETYKNGLTPNPDVLCNKEIKFGMFDEWSREQGFDYIATGHYARVKKVGAEVNLIRAKDQEKDQSYFLYRLGQEQLVRVMFPLGYMSKGEVREKAKEMKLFVADKPDSMGICFIGDVDVSELLEQRLGENPGEVIYKNEVVGEHRGLWFYTNGSRGGFQVDKKILVKMNEHPEKMEPLFVIGKNIKSNQLIVGSKQETYQDIFNISDLSWINDEPDMNQEYLVRIRNLGKLYKCTLARVGTEIKVTTKDKVMGVASGQSGVIYEVSETLGEERVVGGGVIV